MPLAAVLGSAKGGFDELVEISRLAPIAAIFAVNDAAAVYPGLVDEFVTLHPEHLPRWLAQRSAAGLSPPRAVVSIKCPEYRDRDGRLLDPAAVESLVTETDSYLWPGMNASGSSGLFAVKRALRNYSHVVLCGVPMDPDRAHFFDPQRWNDFDAFRGAWNIALPFLRQVRSMSGWTAELLGKPTPEWLAV